MSTKLRCKQQLHCDELIKWKSRKGKGLGLYGKKQGLSFVLGLFDQQCTGKVC